MTMTPTARMCGVGDNVMDRYLASGTMYPGGGAVNVAVHSRRAGWEATYLGLLGHDEAGKLILDALQAEDVETGRVRQVPEPNAVTDVVISASGERTFESYTMVGAALELTADDEAFLSTCDWIYSNYSSASEDLVPRLGALAALAFDFSYKTEEYAGALLPHVAVAAFSRAEASEQECRELIARSHRHGAHYVIVTRGSAGTLIGVEGSVLVQPAAPTHVVDTLGAGDAFLARFLCGVYGSEQPAEAAAAASRAAAEVCTYAGAFGHPYPLSTGKE